jgi:hypothetical protein
MPIARTRIRTVLNICEKREKLMAIAVHGFTAPKYLISSEFFHSQLAGIFSKGN